MSVDFTGPPVHAAALPGVHRLPQGGHWLCMRARLPTPWLNDGPFLFLAEEDPLGRGGAPDSPAAYFLIEVHGVWGVGPGGGPVPCAGHGHPTVPWHHGTAMVEAVHRAGPGVTMAFERRRELRSRALQTEDSVVSAQRDGPWPRGPLPGADPPGPAPPGFAEARTHGEYPFVECPLVLLESWVNAAALPTVHASSAASSGEQPAQPPVQAPAEPGVHAPAAEAPSAQAASGEGPQGPVHEPSVPPAPAPAPPVHASNEEPYHKSRADYAAWRANNEREAAEWRASQAAAPPSSVHSAPVQEVPAQGTAEQHAPAAEAPPLGSAAAPDVAPAGHDQPDPGAVVHVTAEGLDAALQPVPESEKGSGDEKLPVGPGASIVHVHFLEAEQGERAPPAVHAEGAEPAVMAMSPGAPGGAPPGEPAVHPLVAVFGDGRKFGARLRATSAHNKVHASRTVQSAAVHAPEEGPGGAAAQHAPAMHAPAAQAPAAPAVHAPADASQGATQPAGAQEDQPAQGAAVPPWASTAPRLALDTALTPSAEQARRVVHAAMLADFERLRRQLAIAEPFEPAFRPVHPTANLPELPFPPPAGAPSMGAAVQDAGPPAADQWTEAEWEDWRAGGWQVQLGASDWHGRNA